MTGGSRCQVPTTMMGRGADGGCGTEEKPCPVSRLTPAAKNPAPAPVSSLEKLVNVNFGVDLYTQALKTLSERSPFDTDEILATTAPSLPNGLASLLSKRSDSKRKHKRLHLEAKSSRKGSSQKASVWIELENYFRELKFHDIERLYRLSSWFSTSFSSNSCFTIPAIGDAVRNNKKMENEGTDIDNDNVDVNVNALVTLAKEEEEEKEEIQAMCPDVPVSDSRVLEVIKEDVNGELEECMEIDNESRDSGAAVGEVSAMCELSSQSCSSVEWVLGSRNRVLLTTTRPTKKRKFLGETAGLERLNIAQPCEGIARLCHVCSVGETGDQLNQLAICNSCNVVVHQKCYGVQGDINSSWICSRCKSNADVEVGRVSGSDRDCVLCPKSGGALKVFQRIGDGSGESVEFAHLFCSQWIPEVYISDTRLMEPLLCLEGVKDVRSKLVCSLCKVKVGLCIRCSDGSCRTSFHPICAREAGSKLEIWGKFGCDDIELRAFCAKHSECVDGSLKNEHKHPVVSGSVTVPNQPAILPMNKIKKLKIGCKNKVTFHIGGAESKSKHVGQTESEELILKDTKQVASGDGLELSDVETVERSLSEDVKKSYALDLALVLKQLIDLGKVSLEQIASDIGISVDILASTLTDNQLGTELCCKILKWLREHAYIDTYQKNLKAKVRNLAPLETGLEATDGSDTVVLRDLDISDVVPFKSVPTRRRTVGDIRIFKEGKVMSIWNDEQIANDESIVKPEQEHVDDEHDKNNSLLETQKNMDVTFAFEDAVGKPLPVSESTVLKSNSLCDAERNGTEGGAFSGRISLLDLGQDVPCSSVETVNRCDRIIESGRDSFVHPYVQKKVEEVERLLKPGAPPESSGTERFLNVDVCNDKELSVCVVGSERTCVVNGDELLKSKEMGVLDLFPENDLEGEIIYFQQRLLANGVELKHLTDQLVCKVVKNLSHELYAVRKRKWDEVLVNQYIYELKEARKQGRKERRVKEAQAVLAAATAAAAASSRNSSFRKDAADESLHHELKVESSRVRSGISWQLVSRARVMNSSLAVTGAISDGYSDLFQRTSGSSKEHSKSCDICRRPESSLNTILVCSSCKVAVHLNCYHSVQESTGPWYCELCEQLSLSKISSASLVNSLENPAITECGLCGASTGAFRKSSNGQWIHAVCAEWIFDSTFKRGQVHPVEGMETVTKGNDICAVCNRRYGACLKCNYGNCQSTFHPSCARSAGYYMHARSIGGGKTQRKAYCSKHSLEQRAKAETQKLAAENLKIAKQYRVELEKLRLLCERIVRREKLKRELVLCNRDIVASKRDSVAVSRFLRRPYISHEFSSESVTTSLKGDADCSRSYSEAIEKPDDVTVDSALSVKKCIRLPLSIDIDQKTDDSSTSQRLPTPKSSGRVTFSGKQMPIRAAMACRDFPSSGEKSLNSKKHAESFEKELVMTSDQASMKNRRLPKGYIYVPIDCLSNGKPVNRGSVEEKQDE